MKGCLWRRSPSALSNVGLGVGAFRFGSILMALQLFAVVLQAFPPAPDHVISGMVRDELGNPLYADDIQVILTTSSGVELKTDIRPGLGGGLNYRLRVPLDSGLTTDLYRATALRPTVPFRMSVKIGTSTFVPIEMIGDFRNLGKPAKETHMDLTLGEDLDGDGLPDAWERALLMGGQTISDIRPENDTDGDGLSDLLEYLAGTYAFDPNDGFKLDMVGVTDGWPVLEFTAIRGRSYSILRSTDLEQWEPVPFRISGQGEEAPLQNVYQADDVRVLRVEAEPVESDNAREFFKLSLQ